MANGIRIFDKIGDVVCVKLQDILDEIHNGSLHFWSLLYFYGMAKLRIRDSVIDLEDDIRASDKGVVMSWTDVKNLAEDIFQLFDVLIIGCLDEKFLLRYENDRQMYKSCDIVIEMIDSSYWEVFSRDKLLLDRLAKKFKSTELIHDNFDLH